MKNAALLTLLLSMASGACSNSGDGGNNPNGAGTAGTGATSGTGGMSATGGTGATAGTGGNSGAQAGTSAEAGSSAEAGAPSVGGPESWVPQPMPLISRGVPVFVSSTGGGTDPKFANDDDRTRAWSPDELPCWIAYDLSSVPVESRGQVLLVWYEIHAGGYILASAKMDYSIEINAGAGGGSPPADGWKTVASETNNTRSTRQHLFDLAGGNWVRLSVTKNDDPTWLLIDVDVHSAPHGASDSWLFMGDSITHLSTGAHGENNIPALVHARDSKRWPVIVPAGVGGTNTSTGRSTVEETMKGFPGRFVVLNYGTNDHKPSLDQNGVPVGFVMDQVVEKVLAAGKIPAIPHMPWADVPNIQDDGPPNNAAIDALYAKYPQIFHGPDFWAAFEGRTDLIPSGDVHPNEAGRAFWREQWADAMVKEKE